MVASEPFADSVPTSRTVAGDPVGDAAERLPDRLGREASSTILDFIELRLAVREGESFS